MPSSKRLPRLLSRALLAALLACGLAPAHADFNDGVLALMLGDNDKALKTFVPLAEASNHAYAQYYLGLMYAEGRGVDVDLEAAAKWYRKAAEKAVQIAQFRLGGCYERGEGVSRDPIEAYGWYGVSAQLGNPKAAAAMNAIAAQLSADEKQAATELSQKLIQQYGTVPPETSRAQ